MMFFCASSPCCAAGDPDLVETITPPQGEAHDETTEPIRPVSEEMTPRVEEPVEPEPEIIVIEVKRSPGQYIGIDFELGDMTKLVVDRVRPQGLVAKWNAENPEKAPIQKGDTLVQVNDKIADGLGLMVLLQSEENLKLTIAKAPREKSEINYLALVEGQGDDVQNPENDKAMGS